MEAGGATGSYMDVRVDDDDQCMYGNAVVAEMHEERRGNYKLYSGLVS